MQPRRINPWLVLVIVGLAQFMVILDATIVNVALPSIQRGLHFSPESLQWIVNAYTLAFGGFLHARRPRRGPARAPAPLPHRHRAVLRRLIDERARGVGRDPRCRTRPSGTRRRTCLACGALGADDHLRRGPRADDSTRGLERGRRRRRSGRTAARRRAHQPALVAVDVLRERPGRRGRHRARAALRAGEPGRERPRWGRYRGRRVGHRRARGARVRTRQCPDGRAGCLSRRWDSVRSPWRCSQGS